MTVDIVTSNCYNDVIMAMQPTTATSPRRRFRPLRKDDAVRRWGSVTLHLAPEHLARWSELARQLGMARITLVREALAAGGLPYAEVLAKRLSDAKRQRPAA